MYIYERGDWPNFKWDHKHLASALNRVSYQQGQLVGHMKALGFSLQQEAVLATLTQDVLKTSEIEGEIFDAEQVRSSLARKLGVDIGGLRPIDRNVEGIVEVMLDATQNFNEPLTAKRLFGWHKAMFPSARSGLYKIKVGAWRDDSTGPMTVISGPLGHEKIHFQAPAAKKLKHEMLMFLKWFEEETRIDPIIKAGIAHLWFVTVHPFDDGNGRLARAIADMCLARAENASQRFYSMSAQIRLERNNYYNILEQTQKGSLHVTSWLEWFLVCLSQAIERAQNTTVGVLYKAQVWKSLADTNINDRQRKIINLLLDDFKGKLTSSKWAKLAKCSQDTALRDITHLLENGILIKDLAGGRSTSYSLQKKL